MKKTIKAIFLIVSFSFLLAGVVYTFLGPFSRISLVELRVDQVIKTQKSYIKKEEAILSHLHSYKGIFFWQVSLKDLVKKIHTIYLGAEVLAQRKFPNHLIITLKPKTTALLLLKEGGAFYSVSLEGDLNEKKTPGESLDFPILRGKAFWDHLELRKKALSILFSLPQQGAGFSVKNISEISYNQNRNSLLFYLLSGGFIVEMKNQAGAKKIQNINFVLNYLNQKGRKEGLIDARLNKKIIVKKLD